MTMKILYGVQGTGNGHTTRARMMAEALSAHDVDVDYLFTGKDGKYFNMDCFGEFKSYPGLSFVAEKGQINYYKSYKRNNIWGFLRDIRQLDLTGYDLVLTDFEPVTAWKARKAKVPSIGLSHQNAFRYKVPVAGSNPVARLVLKWFAPADLQLGFHWHHFGQPILPPMIKTNLTNLTSESGKILVYLPFLELDIYHDLFNRFPQYQFVQYHPALSGVRGNVTYRPLSREGFLEDFRNSTGVITHAGFGTCSEALHYGKKLFVVPLQGQMEQLSNAAALKSLGIAKVKAKIKRKALQNWLDAEVPEAMNYPDVAAEIAQWIIDGRKTSVQELSQSLWSQVPNLPQLTIHKKNQSVKLNASVSAT